MFSDIVRNETQYIIIISMKKIVTILSAALVLLAGAPAFAQGSFGAGYLSSTEVVKSGSSSTERTPMNGFYAGIGYTVPIANGLNFTPGLYYGFAMKNNVASIFGLKIDGGKQQDHFVNVPLHFSFGFGTSPDLRLFVYGGPSVSFALASKIVSGSNTYDRLKDNDSIKRLDVMLGGGIGLELMQTFRVTLGYDFGMLNRYSSNNYTVNRNQMTAGVAIIF